MIPRNADEVVIALGRSMRRVRLSLALLGAPCLIALAGLGFRGALEAFSPGLPGVLEIAATAAAVGLLLAVLAGWLATRRALRQLDLRLRESTARLALDRQALEAARSRHGLERQIKTLELEHAMAIREARLRIRELEQTLDERAAAPPPADAEPPAPPTTTLNRPPRMPPEADSPAPDAAPDDHA